MTIHIEAVGQNILEVMSVVLYRVVYYFEFGAKIVKYDHSNESYWMVRYCGV